jgi:hypothetical protein
MSRTFFSYVGAAIAAYYQNYQLAFALLAGGPGRGGFTERAEARRTRERDARAERLGSTT